MAKRFILFLLFAYFLTINIRLHAYTTREKNVLILGGNGFIGSHTVDALLDNGTFNVTILNRGHNYFNSKREIEVHVHHTIRCDRNTLLRATCHDLLNDPQPWYDAVVDFSSYQDKQIEQIIDVLKDRVGLYVLVSSDSVYEVSGKHHEGRTREQDSENVVKNSKKREELERQNVYGKQKKECEERLKIQREQFGFPFVILRLADAIGEKDTTYRWWNYQLYVKLHKLLNETVPLPEAIKKQKFSMVYAKDVGNAIVHILNEPTTTLFQDKVLNLAFKEDLTLEKVLDVIGKYYGMLNVTYNTDEDSAWFKYPTAYRGPLDTTNAELLLQWSPTDFETAANNTCAFFENAMVDPLYAKERELLLAEFIEETLPDSFIDDQLLIQSLIQSFSPAVFDGIDIGMEFDDTEKLIESSNIKEEL